MKIRLTLIGFFSLLCTLGITTSSCNRDDDPKPNYKEQNWSKEIYEAMQEIYLWNDALPSSFDPTKYATPENALKYLRDLKRDPLTNEIIDRYSSLDKIGGLTGEIEEGRASSDYGFMIIPAFNDKKQISFYVNYVYKDSPAAKAGINRTYEIIKVNGSEDVHPKIDGNDLDSKSSGYINVVKTLFQSSNAKFTFRRTDGSILETSLSAASYKLNSVFLDRVFTINSTKIGYLVFNYFLEAPSLIELRNSFSKFESEGISELIIDLRYNGGGSVTTSDTLSNMIVPASANGQIMNYTIYNKLCNDYFTSKYGPNYSITTFKKEGNIALKRVFFIVSRATASASELLINNLKPYMDVKLIGEKSYGKPCGFWRTPIGYKLDQTTPKEGYDLYAISFETLNAKREGRYYTGMTVDKEAPDGFWYDWGDLRDPCLAQAIYYIQNNHFTITKSSIKTIKVDMDPRFNGMIDFRKVKK